MPGTPLLELRGLAKSFGATRALRQVDLQIGEAEIHALIGENGAGKSTLMKVLSGAHPPDAGTMFWQGRPYSPSDPRSARLQGVSMVYQELALAPDLSAMENILLGSEPVRGLRIDWKACRAQASKALAQVGLGDLDPATRVGDLPAGARQLVEIARAVASGCRLLVLDEPTSSLTSREVRSLLELVRQLRTTGVSTIYISHVFEELQALCSRFTVLRDGETVASGDLAATPLPTILAAMVGREITELYPRSPHTPGEVLLEASGIAGFRAPRSASLQIRRGEVVGIAGLMGSGRTELLRCLFGLDSLRSGKIAIGGQSFPSPQPPAAWQRGLGIVSEDRKQEGLAQSLSIAENLTLSRLGGLGPYGLVLPARQRAAALPWIREFPIKCEGPAQPVEALSGGNQQKVAIARLLHHDSDVLLLDEPTRGIDVGSKAHIYSWIDRLALGDPANGRKAKGILLVSSYLPELLGICDRIAVMARGHLGPARPAAEWHEHTLIAAATDASNQPTETP